MRRSLTALVSVVLLYGVVLSGVARADVTLGSTSIPAGADPGTCAGKVIMQQASDPSTPFNAPGPGTINQWSVYAGPPTLPGSTITFVVLRAAGTGYSVVGADTRSLPNPLPASGVATYVLPSPIAVSGGETLGLYDAGSSVVCYLSSGSTPLGNVLAALGATGIPSAGQTLLVSGSLSPGGYRMMETANFVPTPSAKCKKHKKKKKSAESAKKCKKKKKKKG